MDTLFEMVYVDGNILETFVRLAILFFSFDFIITFAGLLKSFKSSIS